MAQVQVISGADRRRSWTEEQKRALVAEAFAPGAVVTQVARRTDVSTTLLYRWRDQFAAPGAFAQVMLTGPGTPARPRALSLEPPAAVGIEIGQVRCGFHWRHRRNWPRSSPRS